MNVDVSELMEARMEAKIVNFPKAKSATTPLADSDHVKKIKKAHRALCSAINAATKAGLKVECNLDANDTYGDNLVRSREPSATRRYR